MCGLSRAVDMTAHSGYLKGNEGVVQNQMGSMSSASGPWWSGLKTQSTYSESLRQFKSASMEHPPTADLLTLTSTKQAQHGLDQGVEKGDASKFIVFPGDFKRTSSGQKSLQLQEAFSVQSALPGYGGSLDLGFGQPVISDKYPYGDRCYGVFSTYGHQLTGRIMLPPNLTSDNGPIFVNAKQYHGIIRRRRSRAKAEMANKVVKSRKPYLHHSRHLHAMRRPRGSGGRFLNTKKLESLKYAADSKIVGEGLVCRPAYSQVSEVLQSDNSKSASPKETNGGRSNNSGSEVTSMFSLEDRNYFPAGSLCPPSMISFSEMMDSENTMNHFAMTTSTWAAAANKRCNLKV